MRKLALFLAVLFLLSLSLVSAQNLNIEETNNLEATLTCDVGFNALWIDWNLGDGNSIIDTDEQTITHQYNEPGRYEIWCGASDREQFEQAYTVLELQEEDNEETPTNETPTNDTETPEEPTDLPEGDNLRVTDINGLTVDFACAPGFDGLWTDWNLGDGTTLQDTTQEITHTYNEPGRYEVWCGSSNRQSFQDGYLLLDLQKEDEEPEEPPSNGQAELQIVEGFPYDHNYALECVADFNATEYTFDFGDGTTETRPVFDVYHTYNETGEKTVTCTATNGENTAQDTISINVNSPLFGNPYNISLSADSVEGHNASFMCRETGFQAGSHRWFVDSSHVESTHERNFTYTFEEEGSHEVRCQALLFEEKQTPQYYDYTSHTYHNDEVCRGSPFGDCTFEEDSVAVNIQ